LKDSYILLTVHRPSNTDSSERLRKICSSLIALVEKQKKKVVFPVHPRTLKFLKKSLSKEEFNAFANHSFIEMIEPASFLDMIVLERNSQIVITDSGGVQKEAYFFEKPCLILRSETEWVEIIDTKMAALVDVYKNELNANFELLTTMDHKFPKLFGDGNSAAFICRKIIENIV